MSNLQNDITAIATLDAKDFLFKVTVNNGKAILSYYESQDPNEAHLVQYLARNIKTPDGEHVYVNVDLPVVSAVTYRDFKDGTEEVRVYYVAEGSFKVNELTHTVGSGEWKKSKEFNNNAFMLAKDSGISANAVTWGSGQNKNGQLKVYVTNDGGNLNCYYANLGVGNWSPRTDINV